MITYDSNSSSLKITLNGKVYTITSVTSDNQQGDGLLHSCITLLKLEELINCIGKYKSNIWSQYYTFKYNIESIKNINEIEQIKVVYTFPRVEIIEI